MGYSAAERDRSFEPLPPLMTKEDVLASDVRIGDWMVFSPGGGVFSERREWVPVEALEMGKGKARFDAPGRETIEVSLGMRVSVCRARPICSVREYRDGRSVNVCRWNAGHDGMHEWEYPDDEEEAAGDDVSS